jgi:hypothetical protein
MLLLMVKHLLFPQNICHNRQGGSLTDVVITGFDCILIKVYCQTTVRSRWSLAAAALVQFRTSSYGISGG